MALTVPNLSDIFKPDVKTGEAITKIQTYVNLGVPVFVGTAVAAPPTTSTPPATTQPVNPGTGSNPRVTPPPTSGVPRADQG